MGSKFSQIINAHKQRQQDPDEVAEETPAPTLVVEPAEPAEATPPPRRAERTRSPSPTPGKRGRPTGKRSDPDYTQVTAYIREETYRDVRIALLQDGGSQEFSDLIDTLLQRWLKARNRKSEPAKL